MSFSGKVALVTGAQEGIGRSMAIAFAEKGARVAINWLDNKNKADRVADILQPTGVTQPRPVTATLCLDIKCML